ncbi:hypothetical protein T484DRAFT_1848500 [Baffinella frigidus]|nr:hypothetical protein T484DRAFT_1848500 [Cryptophyta sp. CCMP2293]
MKVVLSACNSLELGNKLHRKGVPYVVCWVGEVHVSWCLSFSKVFYGYLMNNAGCYGAAFETTCAVIDTKHPRSRASNAASPCILWDDGKGPGSAVDGDWVSKQGSAAGRSVWRELGLRELAEEEEKEQEEPSPPPPDSMPLDFSPAAPASSSSEDDGEGEEEEDDDEVTRMANNRKGQAELKGFQMLGFNLDLAEEGIRGYRAWEFDGETVKLYGLVEERKYPLYEYGELVAGKFLLMYQTQALRDIFGDQSISGYTDLWKAGGVIESAAPTVSTEARKGALMFFRESLSIRQKQRGDDTHKHMTEEIKRAIGAIGKSVKEEEAAEKEAGTRHAAEEAAKKKEEAEAARTADNTRRRLLQEAATEEAAAEKEAGTRHAAEEAAKKKEEAEAARTADNTRRRLLQEAATEEAAAEKEAAERKAVAEREAAALTAAGLSSQEQRHAATQANKEEKKAKKQEKANRRL